jgi:hypothetical protein
MKIDDLTIGDARQLAKLLDPAPRISGLERWLGAKVFIRTVTFYYLGKVTAVEGGYIVLDQASWVSSTGPLSVALKTGELAEVDSYPDGKVFVAAAAVVDICEWDHDLPRG